MHIKESLEKLERLLESEQNRANWKDYSRLQPRDKLRKLKEKRGDIVAPHIQKYNQLGGPLDRMAQMERYINHRNALQLKKAGILWLIFTGGCLFLSWAIEVPSL